ncbi:MAG: serine hydrolase domain-containing protein [Bacteroidota bacterium]
MKSSVLLYFLCLSLSLSGQQQEITTSLDRYAQHDRLSGVALVQQKGKTVFAKAYGCANYESALENEINTIFNIGSISKQFTAAAILHLVEAEKIKLTASINTYLSQYASERWKKVTVHHLLSHTSGIPSLLQSGQGLDDVFPEERAISLPELIGYFKNLKLTSRPGKKYRYNNSGYVLLVAIIEEVSGQSYGDFMQAMFEQYGLQNSSHGEVEDRFSALPYYGYTEAQRKSAPLFHPSWLIGAGSIYSTVSDLAKWNQIIHSATFLTAELRQLYFQPHEESGNGNYYAYGWQILEREGKTYIHHDGTTFGYTCDLLYEPKADIFSVLLTNQTHESLNLLGKSEDFVRSTNWELMQIMQGKTVEPLPKLTINHPNIKASTYTFSNDYQLRVTNENGVWKVKAATLSPLIYAYEKPIELNSEIRKSAARAVAALTKKKFARFAKECDGTMKVLTRLGVIRLGLHSIMKGMGEWERSVIYKEADGQIYFRLYCENGAVDFFLAYDEAGKIQGIFDIQHLDHSMLDFPLELSAKTTQQGLYINGFTHGTTDVELIFEDDKVLFRQLGRVVDVSER